MLKNISSTQNPLIKKIILLQEKSKERKKTGAFVIEGKREIELALKGGYLIETILFSSVITSKEEVLNHFGEPTINLIEISAEVYKKIAYRSSTEGIIAISKTKDLSLINLNLRKKDLFVLVAEAPEKPGNIGAILRTAYAANVDAVIIANPKTDLYNPNIIRSSVGCLFTNTLATGSTSEIITFLEEKKINIFSAILQESEPYYTQDFTRNTAIIVGTESTGLSQEWRTTSYKNIHIPMQGEIDSMNVSVAAGILLFEVKRQRNFK